MKDDNSTSAGIELDHTSDAALGIKEETAAPSFIYSLVLAEVIFQTNKGVSSQRCQLFSKADTTSFPAARLGQLQSSAAHQVQAQVTEDGFKALEVVILGIHQLGWMTDVEFWGSEAAIPKGELDTPTTPTTVDGHTNGDKVTPIRRP